ncbi:MAG: CoA transferase [Myxococcales bacterium]|nr:CoA transferase [Myxococcales bacterium]
MSNLFDGIRVLDVGSFVFGPAAATVMADFGADVVKVEPPTGDPYRYLHQMPPLPVHEEDYCWLLTSRGKKSVALDLKDAEARELLLRLVDDADVFVTNYPVRVLESLALRYEDLRARNPRLVFAHATGFGPEGPEAHKPGYDATAWWARTGLQDLVRPKGGVPAISVPGMGDHPSAMALFGAIMMGLYRRERTGEGSCVRSSLLANGCWSNAIYLQAMLCGAEPYGHVDITQPGNAVVNQYETRDGRWLLLALVQEDKLWPRLCAAIERPDLVEDARFLTRPERRANAQALYDILAPLIRERDFEDWRKRLDEQQITFGHVATTEELEHDPQLLAAGIQVMTENASGDPVRTLTNPIEVDGSPKVAPRRAPSIGEHTDEILGSLGLGAGDLASLRERGAIG